jgi:hypothetical protein
MLFFFEGTWTSFIRDVTPSQRSRKTVEFKVFLQFFAFDGMIRCRIQIRTGKLRIRISRMSKIIRIWLRIRYTGGGFIAPMPISRRVPCALANIAEFFLETDSKHWLHCQTFSWQPTQSLFLNFCFCFLGTSLWSYWQENQTIRYVQHRRNWIFHHFLITRFCG